MLRQIALQNVAMTTGNNEYSVVIPSGALEINIKLRDTTNALKVYTTGVGNGGTPNPFITVDPGTTLTLQTKVDGQTLYLMCTASSVVAEVAYCLDS